LPVPAIAAAAVVAAIVAFVVGISGGGSAKVATASGDGFVLKAPEGWVKAAVPAAPALGSGAVAVAPPGAAAGEVIAAGRVAPAQAATLVRGAGSASRVQLGAGDAVSYGDALYLLPTSEDSVVLACQPAPAVKAACGSVAASLELSRGSAQPLGPTDDGARAVNGALTRLRDGVRNPTQDLGGAPSRSAQARAAGDLARAYGAAAKELSTANVGALAQPARDQLAGALKAVGDAWARYRLAARSGSAAGAASARSAIARARGRVGAARSALAGAGYPGGGG
jgi:hypothetical protein